MLLISFLRRVLLGILMSFIPVIGFCQLPTFLSSECDVYAQPNFGSQVLAKFKKGSFVYIIGKGKSTVTNYVKIVKDSVVGYVPIYYTEVSTYEFENIPTFDSDPVAFYGLNGKKDSAKLVSELVNQANLVEKQKEIDSLASIKQTASLIKKLDQYGLLLAFNEIWEDYSVGFSIRILNGSKKTIKYAWFTTRAINPVGDLISTKIVRGIGPILTKETGSYDFENVHWTKVAERLDLVKIKIEYMDGSSKVYDKAIITKIKL